MNWLFKETKSKKSGRIIVIGDLKALVLDSLGVKNETEAESQLKGNKEYIIHCPFCKEEGHTKHKLYITPDFKEGHCFVCSRTFIGETNELDTSFNIPDFGIGGNSEEFKVVPLSDPTWTLSNYYEKFDDYSEIGYNYLIGRHGFMKDLYKILKFKFWKDNVVMPFFYKGELFYYQIRFTGNNGGIRYFFPPISKKPPYIIEHGDNRKFIICEGVFDAIALLIQAPEYTPMAVLGSSISDYQLEFLREYVPQEIKIYMDETSISKNIMGRIKTKIDYCPISIIPSTGTDPEEKMISILKSGGKLQWINDEDTNCGWSYRNFKF